MANVITTPFMNLPNPVPSVDPGPDYSFNVQSCFNILDQHNHTPGSGNLITPAAININSDLAINSNNLTLIRSSRYSPQPSALAGANDLDCVYVSGVDLYYNDGDGNQVRITQGGSVTGSSGTISGLPSGTASASYSGGTFVFQSATNTSAVIDGGSLILRNNTALSKGLTLSPPNAMASNYSLTLPAIPGAQSFLSIDTGGNIGAYAPVASGLTGSNIAAATITATNMAAGSVTGGPGGIVASNINLPGNSVTVGGNLTVTTVETSPLLILRGSIASNGTIVSGTGFSLTHVGTGHWQINFSAFGDNPGVSITPFTTPAGPGCIVNIINITTTLVEFETAPVTNFTIGVDSAFSFVIVGQRV